MLRWEYDWWSVGAGPKVRAKTLEERLNSCCRGATTKEFDFYIVFEAGSIGRGGGGANRINPVSTVYWLSVLYVHYLTLFFDISNYAEQYESQTIQLTSFELRFPFGVPSRSALLGILIIGLYTHLFIYLSTDE